MIETVEDREGFARLGEEWDDLLARSGSSSLFLTWEWLFTWWKHLSGDRRLLILVVRRGGETLAICPFAVRPARASRLLPFRAIEFLGTGSVGSDYLDLIVRPGAEAEAFEELAARLTDLRLPLELPQVRIDGSCARILASRLAPRGWSHSTRPTNVCPFIELSGLDWASYLGSLGPAHRANMLRRLRGLERLGEARLEPVRSEEERREALSLLIALHNERWRHRGGSDAFNDRAIIAFHEEFSRIALRSGWLRLMVLRVGGVAVAFFYGFRYGTTLSFYQSGFDPAWSGHSVGLVTMGLAIKRAIEEGAGEFDLLHGAESYKYRWARQERAIGRLELYPPLLRGWATRGAARLGRAARRLGRRLPGLAPSGRLIGPTDPPVPGGGSLA
jgi:CelD/BcsL family acetyltransferase involved in cellulose biosynthesis